MSQDFRPDRNATQASARVLAGPKYAIRLIDGRWHRWDNFCEDWLELPPHQALAPESAAIAYTVAFYGCKRSELRVDRTPS